MKVPWFHASHAKMETFVFSSSKAFFWKNEECLLTNGRKLSHVLLTPEKSKEWNLISRHEIWGKTMTLPPWFYLCHVTQETRTKSGFFSFFLSLCSKKLTWRLARQSTTETSESWNINKITISSQVEINLCKLSHKNPRQKTLMILSHLSKLLQTYLSISQHLAIVDIFRVYFKKAGLLASQLLRSFSSRQKRQFFYNYCYFLFPQKLAEWPLSLTRQLHSLCVAAIYEQMSKPSAASSPRSSSG